MCVDGVRNQRDVLTKRTTYSYANRVKYNFENGYNKIVPSRENYYKVLGHTFRNYIQFTSLEVGRFYTFSINGKVITRTD